MLVWARACISLFHFSLLQVSHLIELIRLATFSQCPVGLKPHVYLYNTQAQSLFLVWGENNRAGGAAQGRLARPPLQCPAGAAGKVLFDSGAWPEQLQCELYLEGAQWDTGLQRHRSYERLKMCSGAKPHSLASRVWQGCKTRKTGQMLPWRPSRWCLSC